jgi:hypothetical protein
MLIAKPLFQPYDYFSLHGKPEMPRFDDTGMNGANRDLVNSLPFYRQEFGLRGFSRKGDGFGGKRVAQIPAPVIQPWAQINRALGAVAP